MEMATSETAKGDGGTSLFLDILLRAAIQDVVYEAINMQAIIAYQRASWRSSAYQHALGCIADKCSLDLSKSMYANTNQSASSASEPFKSFIPWSVRYFCGCHSSRYDCSGASKKEGWKERTTPHERRETAQKYSSYA
jgi:hypothetical protein